MRISDWSSDVCSSDLAHAPRPSYGDAGPARRDGRRGVAGMSEKIRILLVDDQSLIGVGFRPVLEAEDDMAVVGEGGAGQAAIALAASLGPDGSRRDVRLPGEYGRASCRDSVC